jgi:hypothetical protein
LAEEEGTPMQVTTNKLINGSLPLTDGKTGSGIRLQCRSIKEFWLRDFKGNPQILEVSVMELLILIVGQRRTVQRILGLLALRLELLIHLQILQREATRDRSCLFLPMPRRGMPQAGIVI